MIDSCSAVVGFFERAKARPEHNRWKKAVAQIFDVNDTSQTLQFLWSRNICCRSQWTVFIFTSRLHSINNPTATSRRKDINLSHNLVNM